MSANNMNDLQVIKPNDHDQKQIGIDQVVTQQPLPASTHVVNGYIAHPHQPQPVLFYQNGQNPPVIMSNGMNIYNTMTPQMMSISEHRTWSILNILFCCFILGIFACMKSRETKHNKIFGNFQGALQASKSARTLNICATVIGTIIIVTFTTLNATNTIQLPTSFG